ncbi:MAG TPA: family 16 glycoside hydrolase [Pirellulales bacterium]|nr:family 16 glycoside hydrolase [Pirellulales bacterium]
MTFDAYHKWLGIPPAEQPANHYRLLGIATFEDDPDVIETAADQRMALLRTFQTGQHSALSQKLLNELSAAKLCLLKAEKKAAYDAELRRRIDAAQAPKPVIPMAMPLTASPVRPLEPTRVATEAPALIVTDGGAARHSTRKRRRGLGSAASAWLALAAVAIPAFAFVGYSIWNKPRPEQKTPPAARPMVHESAGTDKPQPNPPAPQPAEQPMPSTGGSQPEPPPTVPELASGNIISDGFVPLFNGKDLTGWKTHPNQPGNWRAEDGVLIGSGPAESNLYSERGNFTNFHLRTEASINDGGNSGVFCRSRFGPVRPADGPRWPDGYEAQINSTHSDPNKTGSLYGPRGAVVGIANSIVRPNEWFKLELIAADSHLVVKVNGQTTADYVDADRSFPMGHLALQQHNPQTVVKYRKIEIREDLPINQIAVNGPHVEPAGQGGSASSEAPVDTPVVNNQRPQSVASSAPGPKSDVKPAGPTAKLPSLADLAKENDPAEKAKLTATEAFLLKQHTEAVTRIAFHRTMPLLASAGKDGQILLWNLETRALQLLVHKFNEESWAVKFSPDGSMLALANRNWWGSRLLFKTPLGVQLNEIKDFKKSGGGAVGSIAYSHDGRLFAAGQDDGTIRLWDVAQLNEIAPVAFGSESRIYALAFGPLAGDRKNKRTEYLLAAGGTDGELRTLAVTYGKSKAGDRCTFQPTAVQFAKAGEVRGVRFSPDGKLLGCGRRGSVALYHPRTGESVRQLAADGGTVEWIAFHPHRPWCVTAHNNDHVARIWNTETAELLCELRGHTGGVMCAEFSPDGRHVATASEDFSIKVWDLVGADVPAAPKKGKKAKPVPLLVGD